jgi:hypothetical protein
MVKDCLKSALVAEVNLSKMTKQANLVLFPFTSFQIIFLLPLWSHAEGDTQSPNDQGNASPLT